MLANGCCVSALAFFSAFISSSSARMSTSSAAMAAAVSCAGSVGVRTSSVVPSTCNNNGAVLSTQFQACNKPTCKGGRARRKFSRLLPPGVSGVFGVCGESGASPALTVDRVESTKFGSVAAVVAVPPSDFVDSRSPAAERAENRWAFEAPLPEPLSVERCENRPSLERIDSRPAFAPLALYEARLDD